MPSLIRRLRAWIVSAAVLLLIVLSGFYVYGRYRVRNVLKGLPSKLGVDIQQSTEGFSLSKSEGGHTLFTIKASKAVQYKGGGRAELHDVSIVVYGRESNRFDQIYGSQFEYDPSSGNVTAAGEVHIDLEANEQGATRPDLTPPTELKNPIHLKTSGLVFNRNTGIASTKELIEFRIPQVSGTALGATYDSKAATLTLGSNIHLQGSGPEKQILDAKHGTITKNPNRVVLEDARIRNGDTSVTADTVTALLRDDNTLQGLTADGHVVASTTGQSQAIAQAPHADVSLDAKNQVKSAVLTGGVDVDAKGAQNLHGNAERVILDFGRNSAITKVHAVENVRLIQIPAKSGGQTTELTANAVDFIARTDGHGLERAETLGAGKIRLLPSDAGSPLGTKADLPPHTELASAKTSDTPTDLNARTTTTITADKFIARFDQQGKLSTLYGSSNSKMVSDTPGQPQRTTTSTNLTVTMNPAGGLSSIVQEGSFHFVEPQPNGSREAWAWRASYTPADELLMLTGDPHILDDGMTSTADRIRINRKTGDAFGDGEVKTTYSELKAQPNGAMLATADPIHVTAAQMVAKRASGTAHYSGGARLWQGANIVEAPVIDFDRNNRSVVAQGTGGQRVSTVFLQQGQHGKETPVNVTASRLTYVDAQRRARFEGGVILHSSDGTMTANTVDVYLRARDQQQPATQTEASQLDRIVCEGNIVLQQPNRRGTGDKLVYTAASGKFTLTGGPPSIFDAEHGQVTGDSLTFYSHDDRVLVEGGNTSPSVTKARVIK
ncbi:MAG TPA: LptA/OstA family protein [Terriglobales bacterium]|nr:LptA/OstA family protein [Terriglobales bacterium]